MEFPKIKKSEYAVLMADSNTGVVLDIYFDIYCKSSNQIAYKVLSSLCMIIMKM